MNKRFFVMILLAFESGGAFAAGLEPDTDRTIGQAQAFLRDVSTQGATAISFQTTWAGSIRELSPDNCQTTLSTKTIDSGYEVIVDWKRISKIEIKTNELVVYGPIKAHRNDLPSENIWTEPWISFKYESDTLAYRVLKAMTVLQKKCDTTGSHGF